MLDRHEPHSVAVSHQRDFCLPEHSMTDGQRQHFCANLRVLMDGRPLQSYSLLLHAFAAASARASSTAAVSAASSTSVQPIKLAPAPLELPALECMVAEEPALVVSSMPASAGCTQAQAAPAELAPSAPAEPPRVLLLPPHTAKVYGAATAFVVQQPPPVLSRAASPADTKPRSRDGSDDGAGSTSGGSGRTSDSAAFEFSTLNSDTPHGGVGFERAHSRPSLGFALAFLS
jgi:hypothetical protein